MAYVEIPKDLHPDFDSPGVKPSGSVEIDWDNPLARGHILAVLAQDTLTSGVGGPLRINNEIEQPDNLNNAASLVVTPHGQARDLSGAGNAIQWSSLSQYEWAQIQNFTTWHDIYFVSADTTSSYIWNVTERADFRLNAGELRFQYYTGAFQNLDSGVTVAANTRYRLCAVRRQGVGTEFYLDGKLVASDAVTSDIIYYTGTGRTTSWGATRMRTDNADFQLLGSGFLNRAVSQAEAIELTKDPYQILKPSDDLYALFGAGGATTNTVTGSLNAILQKQGITRQATLNAILQKQGLTLDSSIDALLQKSVDITSEIDGILQKLGITSVTSIEAILQKQVALGTSLDAVLVGLLGGQQTASLDSILKKNGVTGLVTLDAVLQKHSNVSTLLSALLQKTVSLSTVVDAVLQKSVTAGVSIDAILAQAGSGTLNTSLEAILRKTLAVNLSVDALLQKQDLKTYTNIEAILCKKVAKTVGIDAILYSVASVTVSLDTLLKRTGVSITAHLDAILVTSQEFTIPRNLIYVMAEDRVVTVLT